MTRARRAVAAGSASVLLLGVTAALGESAAVPGLGQARPWPPWDLAASPPSELVTLLLVAAWGLGGLAVLDGLAAVAAGARLTAGRVAVIGLAAVALLAVVPPLGSADHLSYAAYGRIAAAGDDPYLVDPLQWRGGRDPVAGAVQPPWQRTPSVYGPVATALMALSARVGGGDLRATIWAWQLLCALSFLAVGLLLHSRTRGDPAGQTRVAVLWTLNPLLLGQLVLGAHVDVVAAAPALAALLLVAHRPFLAGVLVGLAAGTKAPYALAGLAAVWGLRHLPRPQLAARTGLGIAGAGVVLLPAYAAAGPHVLDQVREASRYIALATPWRAVANLVDLVLGQGAFRTVLAPLALVLAAALAVALWRRLEVAPVALASPDPWARVTADAVRAAAVLSAAWVLTTPYALPWYDALVWPALALVAPSLLDTAMLARLVVLCLAYVPGRVVGMSPLVETLTLGARRYVAPVLVLAVVVAVVRWATRRTAVRAHPGSTSAGDLP